MKISHWCVVAGMIMLVFCLKWGMKYQLLWQLSYTKQCYNQIADNALEDGLQAGTAERDFAVPYVDETAAVNGFKDSLLKGFDLSAQSPEGKRMLDCICCIVILQEEYYSVITNEGTTRYPYETDVAVSDCIEKTMENVLKEQLKDKQYIIDFPSVREEACHTLEGVGMLAFIQYGDYYIDGVRYNRFVLSGARVVDSKLDKVEKLW